MCWHGDGGAKKLQKKQLELQEQQVARQEEAENADRVQDRTEALRRRRAERRGQSVYSLANLNAFASTNPAMRSLFQPTGFGQ